MFDGGMSSPIPKYILDTRDSGRLFVSRRRLEVASKANLDVVEAIFEHLVEDNPEFEFSIQEDLFNYGLIIRWIRRLHVYSTNAESNS